MRTFTLFGHGIAYTASPAIQHAALAELGLPHRYEVADIPPSEFAAAVGRLRGESGGANVTIPYKKEAALLVDETSEDAELMRAVNTIVVDGERLIGHNTDLPAIEDELRGLLPTGASHAVVIGAGGASRAVQTALYRFDAAVTVVQRRDGSLDRIGEFLTNADLVVNATPLGMKSGEFPFDPGLLRQDLAVFDLIYRPDPTGLVAAARAAGAEARSGSGMLIGQAWRSLALWLERDGIAVGPELAAPMAAALRRELGGSRV